MNEDYEHITLGDWIATLLILSCVPCVNIVMLFVWAFGTNVNPSKKTFCQAVLILGAIVCILYALFFIVTFAALFTSGRSHYDMIRLFAMLR